jgi:hypothetical protein
MSRQPSPLAGAWIDGPRTREAPASLIDRVVGEPRMDAHHRSRCFRHGVENRCYGKNLVTSTKGHTDVAACYCWDGLRAHRAPGHRPARRPDPRSPPQGVTALDAALRPCPAVADSARVANRLSEPPSTRRMAWWAAQHEPLRRPTAAGTSAVKSNAGRGIDPVARLAEARWRRGTNQPNARARLARLLLTAACAG